MGLNKKGETMSDVFKIDVDQDIPIPEARVPFNLPLADMEIGDSFMIPFKVYDVSIERATRRISTLISHRKKQFPYAEFTTRRIGNHGVRVWRTK